MKKAISVFLCISLLIITPLITSCTQGLIFLGEVALNAAISPKNDPCKGKSTQWDPGSKKYYCYDDEGNKVYR